MPINVIFALNWQIILFVYGLGFFILGFAIFLQVQQSSRLELARGLWNHSRAERMGRSVYPNPGKIFTDKYHTHAAGDSAFSFSDFLCGAV